MSSNFRRIERKRVYDSNNPYYRPRCQQKHSTDEVRRERSDRLDERVRSRGMKSWGEMTEEDDDGLLETDFEAQHLQMTSNQFIDAKKNCLEMQESSSMRERQDSYMSTSSGSWSNSAGENSKKSMSMTPRFTHDELQTEEVQTILARRHKQIQYGKIQECYQRYLRLVPRQKRTKFHPRTPDIYRKYSRRGFDTLIRVWKKQLHAWEPKEIKHQSSSLELPCESTVTTNTTNQPIPLMNKSEDDGDATGSHCSHESQFSSFYSSSAAVKVEPDNKGSSISTSLEISIMCRSENVSTGDVAIKTEISDEYFN